MAATTAAGYQDIRDYVQANWRFIEVRNTTGAAIVRLSPTDPRVTWVHAPGAQTLQLRVVLTGSDADIVEPLTIRSSAIYKVATGGDAFGVETLVEGDATIQAAPDSVTITHSIQIPQV